MEEERATKMVSKLTGPYRTLSSIIHRDRRSKGNINNLPTCLCLAQSACIFDVAALLLSLAFHESIADMYQVINGFCGVRFESVMCYRVKT